MVSKTAEKPDTVARLAAEAKPPKKPEGSPAIKPYQAATRRERAAFDRRLSHIYRAQPLLEEKQKALGIGDGDDIDAIELTHEQQAQAMELKADAEDLAADIEDTFRPLCLDPIAGAEWLANAPLNDLMNLFSWYVAVMQPGEAKPSSV